MDRTTIVTLMDNMYSPAFMISEAGDIIYKNNKMGYIHKKLSKPEFLHIDETDISMDEVLGSDVQKFHVENSNIDGLVYNLEFLNQEKAKLFIFNKTIAADRIIENVMEHIDEVIVIFNQEGVIERMNSICDQILPFKRKDTIGKNILDLVEEGLVEDPIIVKLIKTKEKVYKDIIYPNGKIISYTAVPLFSNNGQFRGGVLTGRDISRIIRLVRTVKPGEREDIDYISKNKEIDDIKTMISRVAPMDASIFITGETGVGKEILTKSVWKQSMRREKPFVAINCAAIPNDLIESELFGYEKGAFTGANKEGKMGLIESADGGTLFLDEIGELSLETQKKLLRVLQERSVMRIGGVKSKKIDVRFISATNKTMDELNDPKLFRQDLFYRLSVIPINIPPLRERIEDILLLCDFYVDYFNKKYDRNIYLSSDAQSTLKEYNWPGNIRELKNLMERLVILSPQDEIEFAQVERMLKGAGGVMGEIETAKLQINTEKYVRNMTEKNVVVNDIMNIEEAHKIVEQEIIEKAIEKYGSITKAASAIGINPSTIYRKIKSGYIEIEK